MKCVILDGPRDGDGYGYVILKSDLYLVTSYIKRDKQDKDLIMQQYYFIGKRMMEQFIMVENNTKGTKH